MSIEQSFGILQLEPFDILTRPSSVLSSEKKHKAQSFLLNKLSRLK